MIFLLSEQSRSISACSTITSTEAQQHSNSHLLQNEARIILPHNPFALENLVKMDHLNITSFDNETDGEGFEVKKNSKRKNEH